MSWFFIFGPMTTSRILPALSAILLMTMFPACEKSSNSEPEPLSNSYTGTLSFTFNREFPGISVTTTMPVSISMDRKVTFGSGETKVFDEEDTLYQDSTPVTRVRMSGSVKLIEAKGAWYTLNKVDYLLVLRHASVEGQMVAWGWSEGAGWKEIMNTPFIYEDLYDEGETQFSVPEALADGSSFSITIPDAEGESVYGYTLHLTAGVK